MSNSKKINLESYLIDPCLRSNSNDHKSNVEISYKKIISQQVEIRYSF